MEQTTDSAFIAGLILGICGGSMLTGFIALLIEDKLKKKIAKKYNLERWRL